MTVEIVQENTTVLFNEDQAVVEFRYDGLNQAALLVLTGRVDDIENIDLPAIIADAAAATAAVDADLTNLEATVTALSGLLTTETSNRVSGDNANAAAIAALDADLQGQIDAEVAARIAAIAQEVTDRNAAITAAVGGVTPDVTALQATVAGHTSDITALDAAVTTLGGNVTTLSGEFDALETLMATYISDISDNASAIAAEIAARAAAIAALTAADIAYVNTTSNLAATDVQDAIDELSEPGPSISGRWRFSTTTTATDPGSGNIQFDNATPASVTNLYVSQTTRPGTDVYNILNLLVSGHKLLIQQKSDAAKFIYVSLSGAGTDNTGWWTLPVTIDDSGTLPDNNAEVLVVLFAGAGGAGSVALNDLTDVDTTGQASGDLLRYNGSSWVVETAGVFSDENETITGTWTLSNYLTLTPMAAPTHSEGRLWYDSTSKAVSYYNEEADVTVNLGQEVLIRVRNTTGVTITNGQAVYINGSAGAALPTIALAQADALATSRCIGLATHDIENNSNGYVCTLGEVNDLNTSAYSAGDVLYLSTSVAGGLTATRPTTGFARVVGMVTVSNVSIGSIKVQPGTTAFRSDITAASQNETITGSWTFDATPTLGTDIGLIFDEHSSAPSTPAAGTVVLYAKADGLLYSKDDAGVETVVTGGGGGGSVATDTIFDAKGDLAVGTGADTASRLAVGTNGYVLTADSAEATGMKWAAAAAGSPLTTKGDLFAYSTADARLPVGSNSQLLSADSAEATGLKWITVSGLGGPGVISGCTLTRASSRQTMTTTDSAISWDTEVRDDESYWASSPNPTRITIPASGWYAVIGTVNQNTDADDAQILYISKNGAARSDTQHQTRLGLSTSIVATSQVIDYDYYAAGDYLELMVDNRTGTSEVYARITVLRLGETTTLSAGVTSDQVITSNTTYQDTALLVALTPGTYRCSFKLWCECHATPDMKIQFNYTGTVTKADGRRITQQTTAIGQEVWDSWAAFNHSITATATYLNDYEFYITVSTAGNLSLQVAQVTSSATAITVLTGSTCKVERVQ